MANEPNFKLKSITSRVTLKAYAGLMQTLESHNEPSRTISDEVRECIEQRFGDMELSEKWQNWCVEQENLAREKREARRNENKKRRHGLWHRIFS